MKPEVRYWLTKKYKLNESIANIAMLGHEKEIEEAEQEQISAEEVADAIYDDWVSQTKSTTEV